MRVVQIYATKHRLMFTETELFVEKQGKVSMNNVFIELRGLIDLIIKDYTLIFTAKQGDKADDGITAIRSDYWGELQKNVVYGLNLCNFARMFAIYTGFPQSCKHLLEYQWNKV